MSKHPGKEQERIIWMQCGTERGRLEWDQYDSS